MRKLDHDSDSIIYTDNGIPCTSALDGTGTPIALIHGSYLSEAKRAALHRDTFVPTIRIKGEAYYFAGHDPHTDQYRFRRSIHVNDKVEDIHGRRGYVVDITERNLCCVSTFDDKPFLIPRASVARVLATSHADAAA